ncbi:hypothetical protein SCHPADRAFT_606289 [Schizopora paradoxa]|uniref:DUF6533 domain-containing protein n=1 Tax=Schizopora paradoxa TaxID=27342 RepID=A0A0H2R9K5_9AGAM|nr:hypothetical protein SCHPADRAFT_606289 [Schizopora paradoxa]
MSTVSLAELAKTLSQTVDVKYFYLTNAVALYYDTLIYFGDEVEFIWLARWSAGKVLYIASRYLAFIDLSLLVVYVTDWHLTPMACMRVFRTSSWLEVAGVLIAEVLLIIRTFALYDRSKAILVYLIFLKIALTIPAIVLINNTFHSFDYISSPAPSILPCMAILQNGHSKMWFAFLCIAIFDLSEHPFLRGCFFIGNSSQPADIVTLTLFRAISSWRSLGRLNTRQAPLLTTLYRDGIIYFVCLFATSLSNVFVMKTKADTAYFLTLIGFQRMLHALLSSKIIINVRKSTASTWTSPSTLPDPLDDSSLRASRMAAMPLEFAQSVELPSRHTTSSVDVETKSEAWSVDKV